MGALLADCVLIPIPRISDARGSLRFVEGASHVPFHVARVFCVYDLPRGTVRGGHAHRECAQLLIAQEGEFEITLTDGSSGKTLTLSEADRGLYIPPGIWVTLKSIADRSVVIVLASAPHRESDYLRSHEDFLQWRREQTGLALQTDGSCLLRPYRVSDAAAFSRSVIESAPVAGRWSSWCTPEFDESCAARLIREAGADRLARRAFAFGIFEAGDAGEHLGGVSLNRIDWPLRSANLGYWVATRATGRGIGTRAAAAICRYGFESLGLARIEVMVEVGNARSRSVALRLGAQCEGILRNRLPRGEGRADAELFGLLPEDLRRNGLSG